MQVSFGTDITEAAFMSVQSYLDWMDASYDLKGKFKKVHYENEDKFKFPRYADGTICRKASIFLRYFRSHPPINLKLEFSFAIRKKIALKMAMCYFTIFSFSLSGKEIETVEKIEGRGVAGGVGNTNS